MQQSNIKLTQEIVELWLKTVAGEFHYTKALDGQVDPSSYPHLREIMVRLAEKNKVRSLGRHDGWYRPVKEVEPVRWQDADESLFFDLSYPMGHEDNSSFRLEEYINLSPGDLVVLAGVSN